MEIYPAIDLRGGQVVRLTGGDYGAQKTYSTDPFDVLRRFEEAGARNVHIIDLDGAKEGSNPNYSMISKMMEQTQLFAQVGGGIRDEERIEAYLHAGVSRVILGTVAAESPDFVRAMVERYKDKIAVSVDAKRGKVAVRGWCETTDLDAVTYSQTLSEMGVSTLIYTDISKDGKMDGTNLDVYEELQKTVEARVIASGGITYEREIIALREMAIYGAVVGKSLYENGLDLSCIIRLGGEKTC